MKLRHALIAATAVALLAGTLPLLSDYRINTTAGGVATLKSTVSSGVHTPHVNVDSGGGGGGAAGCTSTEAAPTYVEGATTNPLSCDLNGNLRTSGSGGGGGSGTEYTEDAAAAANPAGGMMMAVRRDTLTASEVSADGDNVAAKATSKGEIYVKHSDAITAAGAVADAATASGNPVPAGAIYESAPPTYTAGQRTTLHTGTRGALQIQLMAPDSTTALTSNTIAATGIALAGTGLKVLSLPGLYNGSTVDIATGDTTNGQDVDVTRVIPGTAATHLGKAEDAAHGSGDTGVAILGVRRDTAASGAGADGDYATLNLDANGRLHVAGPVTNAGTFPVQVDGNALTALQLIDNPVGSVGAGTAGTGSMLAGCVYNSSNITLTNGQQAACQADAAGRARVVVESATGTAEGATASGSTQSGTMVEGRTTDKTSVTSGQMTRNVGTLDGRQIVYPYALPENSISCVISTNMTGTTSTSLCAAPGAGLRNYITHITCGNSHATVGTNIILQDGSGGTTIGIIPAAAVYGGAAPALPVPLRQPTANTALHVANVTTGASTTCWATGYKGI